MKICMFGPGTWPYHMTLWPYGPMTTNCVRLKVDKPVTEHMQENTAVCLESTPLVELGTNQKSVNVS